MAARKTTTTNRNTTRTKPAPVQKTPEPKTSQAFRPKILILPIAIVVLAVLIWLFRNQLIVATVNGQPITRFQLVSELEKKDGKNVLDSLVTERLILQEAAKKNITVSAGDVEKQIKEIEKSITSQGQNLDLVLAQQGMSREDLDKQIKLQLLLKKMVGDITVSNDEVEKYVEANKEAMPETSDMATIKTQVKQQLEQQKLSEKISSFISSLQKKAKIDYWKTY